MKAKKDSISRLLGDLRNTVEYAEEALFFDVTEAVFRLMEEDGISQKQLAERIGVKPAYLNRLVNHPSNLTLKTLARIAFYCDRSTRVEFLPQASHYNRPLVRPTAKPSTGKAVSAKDFKAAPASKISTARKQDNILTSGPHEYEFPAAA